MSAQDKQGGVVIAGQQGIETAPSPKEPRHRAHAKLWGITVGCIVIVAALSFGVYRLVHKTTSSSHAAVTKGPEKVANNLPNLSSFTSEQKAQYYIMQNNYAAAYTVYEQQLKGAKTPQDRSAAYAALGSTALSAKNYTLAVTYEKQADELNPTSGSAKAVAYAAQMDGDKKTAAQYYQLAIDRLGTATASTERALRELQNDLAEVRQ